MTHLQEGTEKGSGELQVCQLDLNVREDQGADHLQCHHMACAGQSEHQAEPACVCKRQVLFNLVLPAEAASP